MIMNESGHYNWDAETHQLGDDQQAQASGYFHGILTVMMLVMPRSRFHLQNLQINERWCVLHENYMTRDSARVMDVYLDVEVRKRNQHRGKPYEPHLRGQLWPKIRPWAFFSAWR
jgi:hypothetical protein